MQLYHLHSGTRNKNEADLEILVISLLQAVKVNQLLDIEELDHYVTGSSHIYKFLEIQTFV